jgi:glycosyltransferase involved in cell wall biosynthesis
MDSQATALRVAFVLEQTLGHTAHAQNIERELARTSWIDGRLVRVEWRPPSRLPLPTSTWSFRASLSARRGLQSLLRDGRLDAAFIHTQVAALLSGDLMQRVPTVVSLDATPVNFDSQGDGYGHGRSGATAELAKRWVNRRAFLAAQALVSWCEWAKKSLVSDYGIDPARVTVIRPGVDLTLFRPAGRPAGARLRVLFVGGDFTRKGGPDLLSAAAGLPDVELDLVTGAPPARLPDPSRMRVHAGLGPQSPALLRLYREADVFALPSRADCFPQAVAEAMACGLPVVGSRVGAMLEMVRDGETGLAVPPGDPAAIRQALARLGADPTLRRSLGAGGRKLAVAEHDAGANNQRLFQILAEVAEAAAKRRSA